MQAYLIEQSENLHADINAQDGIRLAYERLLEMTESLSEAVPRGVAREIIDSLPSTTFYHNMDATE